MADVAANSAEEGPQLSELESLQLRANKTTDESLESTRRMIGLCEEVGKQYFFMTDKDPGVKVLFFFLFLCY